MIPNYFKWLPHHFKWYLAIAIGVLFIVGGLRRWHWIYDKPKLEGWIYGLPMDPKARTLVLVASGVSMILIGLFGIWFFP